VKRPPLHLRETESLARNPYTVRNRCKTHCVFPSGIIFRYADGLAANCAAALWVGAAGISAGSIRPSQNLRVIYHKLMGHRFLGYLGDRSRFGCGLTVQLGSSPPRLFSRPPLLYNCPPFRISLFMVWQDRFHAAAIQPHPASLSQRQHQVHHAASSASRPSPVSANRDSLSRWPAVFTVRLRQHLAKMSLDARFCGSAKYSGGRVR